MARSLALLVLCVAIAHVSACKCKHGIRAWDEREECAVRVRTAGGWACGARRLDAHGAPYASFRGLPYAAQPVGARRFQELQPVEPWDGLLNATVEGPVCPQTDILYGRLMQPRGMSEACIFANVHVPLVALPEPGANPRPARDLKSPAAEAQDVEEPGAPAGLPILVFIHGGGFAFGSGDSDVYGPENLVAKEVIVITFNYRLNVFGFLSLDSDQVPGNNGLRDMVTLLQWVRTNARSFGGDPDDVTIAGQSAGAAAAHLLTLSPYAQGLFHKAIIMSGTAYPSFYTTSPAYAQYMANAFLTALGVNSTDPDERHDALVHMPLESIMAANKALQDANGLGAFFPVIESHHARVKPVLNEEVEALLERGHGNDVPLLIGFTTAECETFRKRFQEIDVINRLAGNPMMLLSPTVIFNFPPEVAFAKAKQIEERYARDQNGSPAPFNMDTYIQTCSDQFFAYPALKVAEYRRKNGGAPAFLYQFSYECDSPIKQGLQLQFSGAGHIEDLTYVFQVNSIVEPTNTEVMTQLMTDYVTSFMKTGYPKCPQKALRSWRQLGDDYIRYMNIRSPSCDRNHEQEPTGDQKAMVEFFDNIAQG